MTLYISATCQQHRRKAGAHRRATRWNAMIGWLRTIATPPEGTRS